MNLRTTFFSAIVCLVAFSSARAQSALSAREILERSVSFHDPDGKWPAYQAVLRLEETRPNQPSRFRTITIDRPGMKVDIFEDLDSLTLLQGYRDGAPYVEVNGQPGATNAEIRALALTANRITYLHHYYLYLYGIPMKLLEDEATLIGNEVQVVNFHGYDAYRVTISYGEPWHEHDWAFYFDTDTFAMVAYQFWRRSPTEDGEYVLLEGMETIAGIRQPKIRTWYTNVDDENIARDILEPNNLDQ